jgi:hypothetical protein
MDGLRCWTIFRKGGQRDWHWMGRSRDGSGGSDDKTATEMANLNPRGRSGMRLRRAAEACRRCRGCLHLSTWRELKAG